MGLRIYLYQKPMTQKEEIEANLFAMELLIPEKFLLSESEKLLKRTKYQHDNDAFVKSTSLVCLAFKSSCPS